MTTRFAWISDTHLGYAQYGLARRERDFEMAFESAVGDIIAAGIKCIVHTGDLFNSNRPGPAAVRCLAKVHDRLAQAGVFLYVITGNHDWTIPPWPSVLPDYEHGGVKLADHRTFQHGDLVFHGLPSMSAAEFRKISTWPKAHILLLHQPISGFLDLEGPNLLTVEDLPLVHYQAILVGDIHKQDLVHEDGKPLLGYIGATETNKDDEPDEHYWGECFWESGQPLRVQAHVIDTRPVWPIGPIITPDQLTAEIESIKQSTPGWQKRSPNAQQARTPILSVRYKASVPDVIARFRSAFPSDQWIVRFKPDYDQERPGASDVSVTEETPAAVLMQLLRAKLQGNDNLLSVAQRLLEPDVDDRATVEEYVQQRLSVLSAMSEASARTPAA